MFQRVGFLGRIMLILMAALTSFMVAMLALDHWERSAQPLAYPTPYPRMEQTAGIIALLANSESRERGSVLRAVSGTALRAVILDRLPPERPDLVRAPRVEATLTSLAKTAPEALQAYTSAAEAQMSLANDGLEGRLRRALWRLPDGRFLLLDFLEAPRSVLSFLGLPPGIWIGLLGLCVAGFALFTAQREIRPLRALTESVSAFDGGRPNAAIEPRGAPDIRRLAEAVRGMQERVASLLEERSFLIGAISHDLKTHLTRLRLRSETIADPALGERMIADLDGMTDLIETTLAFARGTTISQRRVRLDLADLAAIEAAERSALGQRVVMQGEDVEGAVIEGDPVALRRVITNLIENGIKFGRSEVQVRVERVPMLCRLIVDDDGPGIAEHERAAIFSAFYRVERSRSRKTGGTGLGLAIARQIIEAHGGTIAVSRGPLGGARFTIDLPEAGAAREAGLGDVSSEAAQSSDNGADTKRHIGS